MSIERYDGLIEILLESLDLHNLDKDLLKKVEQDGSRSKLIQDMLYSIVDAYGDYSKRVLAKAIALNPFIRNGGREIRFYQSLEKALGEDIIPLEKIIRDYSKRTYRQSFEIVSYFLKMLDWLELNIQKQTNSRKILKEAKMFFIVFRLNDNQFLNKTILKLLESLDDVVSKHLEYENPEPQDVELEDVALKNTVLGFLKLGYPVIVKLEYNNVDDEVLYGRLQRISVKYHNMNFEEVAEDNIILIDGIVRYRNVPHYPEEKSFLGDYVGLRKARKLRIVENLRPYFKGTYSLYRIYERFAKENEEGGGEPEMRFLEALRQAVNYRFLADLRRLFSYE